MQLYALVDYDNVKPVRKERGKEDVEFNLDAIATLAARIRRRTYPECSDVVIRLYGGWVDIAGSYTAVGAWLYQSISTMRGRREGARILPEIALNVIQHGLPQLIGTYRGGGQKMVDTLIVADASIIVFKYSCPIIFMSDDEEMLPGAISSAINGRKTAISRNNHSGAGVNDALLAKLGVHLEEGVQRL
jgi:hypothetical protein